MTKWRGNPLLSHLHCPLLPQTLPDPRRTEGSANFVTPGSDNAQTQQERQAPLPGTFSISRLALLIKVTGKGSGFIGIAGQKNRGAQSSLRAVHHVRHS